MGTFCDLKQKEKKIKFSLEKKMGCVSVTNASMMVMHSITTLFGDHARDESMIKLYARLFRTTNTICYQQIVLQLVIWIDKMHVTVITC